MLDTNLLMLAALLLAPLGYLLAVKCLILVQSTSQSLHIIVTTCLFYGDEPHSLTSISILCALLWWTCKNVVLSNVLPPSLPLPPLN